ncbi:MAG: TIGR00341 family protein [Chitinophagaceae bacterium]
MNKYIQDILDLRTNSDFEKTKSTINDGVTIRGYNLWMLICSSILASIGLDTNSTAIIIGAMLISPLMSPILGVGFSVAIHDNQLLKRSLRNLGLAVFISFAVSVFYFVLTPLGQVTGEEQARTYPTLLDVLVALFGGIAGIVSISRHEQTNAIPGVAIATALMPPLCVAGFGLGTMHWDYFLGSFYLFFINAVFISLATYLIVKYLHFPEKQFVNKKLQRKYSYWFTAISIIVLMPSIYFLYTVYQKEQINEDINNLVLTPIKKEGNEILKWEVINKDTSKLITVYISGKPLKDSLKQSIDNNLKSHHMALYHLKPMRINLSKEEVSKLSAEMTKQMFQEMQLKNLDSEKINQPKDTLSYVQLIKEVKAAFPFVDTLSNGWLTKPDSLAKIDTIPIIFYKSKRRVAKLQQEQLYQFLKIRFSKDTVALIKQ